ncbi:MAG: hypothetical protein QM784_18355 [Polyangiaceae bacterium]
MPPSSDVRAEAITFQSIPSLAPPHSLSPPSLGHALGRTQSAKALGREIDGDVDPELPYVVTSEEAATLDELIDLPPERLDPLSFDRERAAAVHIAERALTPTFVELAQLLEAEAHADRQAQERAELSIVASELFAMLGETERARTVLSHVPRVGIALHATQQRQLDFDSEDLTAYGNHVRAELRTEVRGGGSHEGRRHLMALQMDLGPKLAVDASERRRHLELSLRAFPTNPRFQFQRLVSQLGDPSQPSVRLRQSMSQDALGRPEVIRDLVHLRAHTSPRGQATHPVFAILDSRRALRQGDPAAVIEALTTLTGTDTALQRAATWLLVSLACHAPEFHSVVEGLLEKVAEPGAPDAELTWLEHRLSKPEDRPGNLEIFSLGVLGALPIEEKLSLAVAARADRETIQLFVETIGRQGTHPGFLPFVEATKQALLGDYSSTTLEPRASAEMLLGIGLGGSSNDPKGAPSSRDPQGGLSLEALLAISRLEGQKTAEPLPVALRLWQASHGVALTSTAGSLKSLSSYWSAPNVGVVTTFAALLMILDGNRGEAIALLRDFLDEAMSTGSPGHLLEAPLRTLEALGAEFATEESYDVLINELPLGPRRTVLTIETAQRRTRSSAPLRAADVTSATPDEHLVSLLDEDPILLGLLAFGLPDDERLFARLSEVALASDERDAAELLLAFRAEGLEPAETSRIDVPTAMQDLTAVPRRGGASDEDVECWTRVGNQWSSRIAAVHTDLLAMCRQGDLERFEAAMSQAKHADDPEEFVHYVARAAAFDPEREPGIGSVRAAELLLQRMPKHAAALRTLLVRASTDGKSADLAALSERLAPLLPRLERHAHAWLAVSAHRQGVQSGTRSGDDSVPLVDLLGRDAEPEAWFLRRMLTHAELTHDDAMLFECLEALQSLASSPLDAATLGLRAAETALRLERWDDGEALLEETTQLAPTHLVALSTRAELLDARGLTAGAAEAYEALGEASCMPTHKVAAWLHAAELYETLHREANRAAPASDDTRELQDDDALEHAIGCLERAVRLDGTRADAFAKLRQYYVELERFEPLEALLTEQLLLVEAPKLRAELEIERARLQLKLGRADEARRGLERALALQPEDEQTLALLSHILVVSGDGEEAEQHLIRLAACAHDEGLVLEAYRQLATLYETTLEQPARAEIAYREILRRSPGDPAGDQLVSILLNLDQPAEAVAVLLELVEHSKDTPLEKGRHLELARIYDAVLGERRRAEEVLERARRKWTNDAQVLRALTSFHVRAQDPAAVGALLDRSLAEARRALSSGRFDTSFFEVIATVGELRQTPDLEAVAGATLLAISANPTTLQGLGAKAAEDDYADLLAPDVLNLPLRALLKRTGSILSAVTKIDLKSMRASPLKEQSRSLASHLSDLARYFGLGELETFISPALGAVCQPLGQNPPALVVGPSFVELESEGRAGRLGHPRLTGSIRQCDGPQQHLPGRSLAAPGCLPECSHPRLRTARCRRQAPRPIAVPHAEGAAFESRLGSADACRRRGCNDW